jgi:hypothetical protein
MCEKQIDGGNYHRVRARHLDNDSSRLANILNRLIGRSDELQITR